MWKGWRQFSYLLILVSMFICGTLVYIYQWGCVSCYTTVAIGDAVKSDQLYLPNVTRGERILNELQKAQDYIRTIKVGLCDPRAIPNVTHMLQSDYRVPLVPVLDDKFTVIILTHNRDELLLINLKNYASMTRVAQVIVYWNNPGRPWPDLSKLPKAVPIIFQNFPTGNKLRLRFMPNPAITTSGVLTMDDDMFMPKAILYKGFDTWKKVPWGMVGYVERGFTQREGEYKYQGVTATPSMILTGASFIHREYLRMYTETLHPVIVQTVDNFTNCEDISMNMLVARHCRCAHAYRVLGTSMRQISSKGLYTTPGHTEKRNKCLNRFAQVYKNMPLISTRCLHRQLTHSIMAAINGTKYYQLR